MRKKTKLLIASGVLSIIILLGGIYAIAFTDIGTSNYSYTSSDNQDNKEPSRQVLGSEKSIEPTVDTDTPENNTPNTTRPVQNSQPTISSTAPTPPPTTNSTVETKPYCNPYALQAWQSGYNSYEIGFNSKGQQIEANHQSRINSITSDYRSRGLGFSGLLQEALNNENNRYNQEVQTHESEGRARITQMLADKPESC